MFEVNDRESAGKGVSLHVDEIDGIILWLEVYKM